MITVHRFQQRDDAVHADRPFSVLQYVVQLVVEPGEALGGQPRPDVELFSYVIDGCLDYRGDNGQNRHVLGGEAQCLAPGAAVARSEANASHSESLHVIQAALQPREDADPVDYQRRYFPDDAKRDRLCIVASPGGEDGALVLASDAKIYAAVIEPGEPLLYYRPAGRRAWVQLARGRLSLNDKALESGDSAAIDGDQDSALRMLARTQSEVLLFELP